MLPSSSLIQVVILCFTARTLASAWNVGLSDTLGQADSSVAHEAHPPNGPNLTPSGRAKLRRRLSGELRALSLPVLSQNGATRGSLSTPSGVLPPMNVSAANLNAPPTYPVECFDPHDPKFTSTVAEDCRIVIDHIILSYPDPMAERTFGYSDSVDIDLRRPENQRWIFGQCIICIRAVDQTVIETFRMVDVGTTASRIVRKCVAETKHPKGGTADIGSREDNYFIAVGGHGDGTLLMSGAVLSSA